MKVLIFIEQNITISVYLEFIRHSKNPGDDPSTQMVEAPP